MNHFLSLVVSSEMFCSTDYLDLEVSKVIVLLLLILLVFYVPERWFFVCLFSWSCSFWNDCSTTVDPLSLLISKVSVIFLLIFLVL